MLKIDLTVTWFCNYSLKLCLFFITFDPQVLQEQIVTISGLPSFLKAREAIDDETEVKWGRGNCI